MALSGHFLILLPSFAAATVFLLTRHRAPYPGSAVIKALGCALLAAIALPSHPLLALALALSALGDWFLALRGERHFLHGLIAFLLAHLVYIFIFLLAWQGSIPGLWGAGGVCVTGLALAVWLYGDLGTMRGPVLAYTCVIVAMAATAMLSTYPAQILIPGALLFMFSDCCIAVRRFKNDFILSGEVTWVSYYCGQLFLFLAITNGGFVMIIG
ncbi:MAG: lysoplasmalogenase [Rhodospirillaceae bacterium]|nr:lysoplasmalogenase [Rhodospirillaceae bacterium]